MQIIINVELCDDLPHDTYTAWVEGPEYKGTVVSADTIGECVKEIGISIQFMENHRNSIKVKE